MQKLLQFGTVEQRGYLLSEIRGHVYALSKDTYGCRVVQRALDYVESDEELVALARELEPAILDCVQDQNANHVVQKILETSHSRRLRRAAAASAAGSTTESTQQSTEQQDQLSFIPAAFDGAVGVLARQCYGCRVLQRVLESCAPAQTRALLEQIHADSQALMRDAFGNYAIQWILQRERGQHQSQEGQRGGGLDAVQHQARVIRATRGRLVEQAKHKFASNVLELMLAVAKDLQPPKEQDGAEQLPRGHYFSGFVDEVLQGADEYSEWLRRVREADVAESSAIVDDSPPLEAQDPSRLPSTAASLSPPPPPAPGAVVLMHDSYGNYVLQRLLRLAERKDQERLARVIRAELERVFSSGSGGWSTSGTGTLGALHPAGAAAPVGAAGGSAPRRPLTQAQAAGGHAKHLVAIGKLLDSILVSDAHVA